VDEENVYERKRRCPQCTTVRVELVNIRGAIVSRHYEYPEDYQVKGLGHISGDDRNVLRLTSILRTLAKQERKSGKAA